MDTKAARQAIAKGAAQKAVAVAAARQAVADAKQAVADANALKAAAVADANAIKAAAVEAVDTVKEAVAADAWRRLFAFFMSTRAQRDRVLARLGLTPNDARAFSSLDTEHGRTMRSLADEWHCDASNATWMVDRLEKRGLAERRVLPTDRRVKLVVLTPLGARTRAELIAGMVEPPPELLALDAKRLQALLAVAKHLTLAHDANLAEWFAHPTVRPEAEE